MRFFLVQSECSATELSRRNVQGCKVEQSRVFVGRFVSREVTPLQYVLVLESAPPTL